MAQSAEEVYSRRSGAATAAAWHVLRLVSPGPEGEPVRSRVPRCPVVTGPEPEQLVDLLIGAGWSPATTAPWSCPRGPHLEPGPGSAAGSTTTSKANGSLTTSPAADSWDALGRPDSELYRGVRSTTVQWRDQASPTSPRPNRTSSSQASNSPTRNSMAAERRAPGDPHQPPPPHGTGAAASYWSSSSQDFWPAGQGAEPTARQSPRTRRPHRQPAEPAQSRGTDRHRHPCPRRGRGSMNASPESRADPRHPRQPPRADQAARHRYGIPRRRRSADGRRAFIYTAKAMYSVTTRPSVHCWSPRTGHRTDRRARTIWT